MRLEHCPVPRLRGHHLICLHFFSGEGYSPGFIENLRDTLKKASESCVKIASGPDDICMRCPYLKDELCAYSEQSDMEIKEMDISALKFLEEAPGNEIRWDAVKGKLSGLFPLWFEKYCIGCGWKKACERNNLYRRLAYGKDLS